MVVYQPQVQVQNTPIQTVESYANGTYMFALWTTVICVAFLMIWAIPFSVVAGVLARMVSSCRVTIIIIEIKFGL